MQIITFEFDVGKVGSIVHNKFRAAVMFGELQYAKCSYPSSKKGYLIRICTLDDEEYSQPLKDFFEENNLEYKTFDGDKCFK